MNNVIFFKIYINIITSIPNEWLLIISDIHGLNISGGEPLPDPADLHCGPDQVVQRAQDRRAAAAHLRDRRQCVRAHAPLRPGPVHRHQRRVGRGEDRIHQADTSVSRCY